MTEQEYGALADEKLVELYRDGDEEAAEYLMIKYKPLVTRISQARFLAGGERDDLLQEGMIGLFRALLDYDSGRQASFATFAALCIDRQMLKAIEASLRVKNRPLNDAIQLTDEEWEYAVRRYRESPERIILEREHMDERLSSLRELLSPLEKKVLALWLAGLDYREISAKLGRPPKAIDNAFQRIRRKAAKEEG